MRVPLPDGSVRWLASKGRAFCDAAGKPLRMAGVNRDITDRKRAEERRAEMRKFLPSDYSIDGEGKIRRKS
jgi:hypothetical protein